MASVNEEMMKQAEHIVQKTKSDEKEAVSEVTKMFTDINFAYPWILYTLIIIPLMAAWYSCKGFESQPW